MRDWSRGKPEPTRQARQRRKPDADSVWSHLPLDAVPWPLALGAGVVALFGYLVFREVRDATEAARKDRERDAAS